MSAIFKNSVDEEQSCLLRIGFHDPNGPQTFVRKRPRISGGGKKKKGQGGQCVAPYDRCVERREKEISH